MKKIRLGVIFDQQLSAGGGYQQAVNAAIIAKSMTDDLTSVLFFSTKKENLALIEKHGINADYISLSNLSKFGLYLRRMIRNKFIYRIIKKFIKYNALEKQLISYNIDLVYFLSPTSLAQDLENLNFITTVWDLCHRDYPEFPEVRWNREFELRERNYKSILPRATAIIVDSKLGKENLSRRYCIDPSRIHVVTFEASKNTVGIEFEQNSNIKIREKYNLDCEYIFYPAQFWAHKNHIFIIEALKILEDKYNLQIGALFSGGDMGNLAYIKKHVEKLELSQRICFAGFVPNEEISEMYRQSVALVMPTYFGPTNLPPLEAFALGIPVLYSDLPGLNEQTGRAALLIDLQSPASLADQLFNLINSKELRVDLIKQGYDRLRQINEDDRTLVIKNIINNYRWKRICWD